jgi:hypothetical protein
MSIQDYYAAAIALFGIILFAKFVTHARTTKKWWAWLDKKMSDTVWNVLHGIAILAAIIGVACCFAVLGWAAENSSTEECLRWVVAIAAACSGLILAFDIGITHRGGGDPKSQPTENPDCTGGSAKVGGQEPPQQTGDA